MIVVLLLAGMAAVARAQTLTPAQIRQAYGLNSLAADGSGQTIAIIGAYHYPNALSALNTFSSQYGLPEFNVPGGPTFTQLDQNGGTSYPGTDPTGSWEGELALDIEWAHALAPKANIVLYEATTDSGTYLFKAVDTAKNNSAVSVVSMSFGRAEYAGETGQDALFTTPSSRLTATPRQGVTFIAATGDSGPLSAYPAMSPNVIAVGGTRLTLSGGNYGSETAWTTNGAGGGGPSAYEAKPAYQTTFGNLYGGILSTLTTRGTPDVSFVADPATGVPVYDPYNGGWRTVGGTSLSAPCWAGLIACANQLRSANGYGTLDGVSQTLPALYGLSSADFHDVTSGTITGSGGSYSAGPGYDLATGRGSPVANLLVPDLAAYGVGVVTGNWIHVGGGSWSTAGNWENDGVPGATSLDSATFGTVIGGSAASITLDGSRLLGGLTFNTNGGGSYTLTREITDTTSTLGVGSATAPAAITNNGGSHTIEAPLVLNASAVVSAAPGTLLAVNGPLSETGGSRSLSLGGGGTLALNNANTHSGTTTVNAGTLAIGHPLAAQSSTVTVTATATVSFAAGTSGPILGGLAGAGNVDLMTDIFEPVTLNVGINGQNTKYNGSLGGPGGLTKQGDGTLTLAAQHNYAGDTLVSAGTLKLEAENPLTVTGNLQVWLAADKGVTTSGTAVTSWADQSGNGRNATAGSAPTYVASNPALHNLPSLNFNGNGQFLNVNLTSLANTNYTIFAVTAKNSSNAPAYFLGNSTGNQGPNNTILQCGWRGNDTVRLGQYGNDLDINGAPVFTGAEVASLFEAKLDRDGSTGGAGHYVFYSDRSSTMSNGNGNTTGLSSSNSGTVGKVQLRTGSGTQYNYFNGDIGEILVYNTALTDAQRRSVDIYLNTKWGLGISGLPVVAGSNFLPSGTPLTILANARLDLGGVNQQVASVSGAGTIANSGGGVTFTVGDAISTTFAGTISDGGSSGRLSLTKVGAGTLTLTGTNTYGGTTTVSAGTLEVRGSLASPVTVGGGGTIAGSGMLTSVTVAIGGHLSPGSALGALNLSGTLALASGAVLDYDLDTPTGSDTVAMPTATLILTGQQFWDFHFTPWPGFGPGSYTLIDAASISGGLGPITSGTINGQPATLAISASGKQLTLAVAAVPEPATWALLGAAILGLMGWSRRRPGK